MSRFIVFDVETPNYQNNRMSAIGITIIENGEIVDDYYSLVDPETHFDYFNIQLTGISEETVKDSPTFPQPHISADMAGNRIIYVKRNDRCT